MIFAIGCWPDGDMMDVTNDAPIVPFVIYVDTARAAGLTDDEIEDDLMHQIDLSLLPIDIVRLDGDELVLEFFDPQVAKDW
jgi:hypothetical protein